MITSDEKATEYTDKICNQSGSYTKGELETAYVTGASESILLSEGEEGSFRQVISMLINGFAVSRKSWPKTMFVVKQVESLVPSSVVPKMSSLSADAKAVVGSNNLSYHSQCLVCTFDNDGNVSATSYTPSWLDIFANDWVLYKKD